MPDLQPHYDREFRCIGPDCDDHCCNTWNVVLDKRTYEKYKSLPVLSPAVDEHLIVLPTGKSGIYAQIKFPEPSRTCPFLTPERWCSIHRDHGPGYLAPICNDYPRVRDGADGMAQPPLLLSCPEAARLVLFQRKLVLIETNLEDERPDYRRFLRMADQPPRNGKTQKSLLEVRTFSLLLVQDRAYPLWQRLFILGLLSKRLAELLDAGQSQLIPKLLGEYAGIVRQMRLAPSMDGIPVQTAAQLSAVIEFAHRLQCVRASSQRMRDCIQDFMRGIQYKAQLAIEDMAPSYAEAHDRYYQPFLEKHPFVLENYLSNYMFRTQFPFGPIPVEERKTPLNAFYLMCLQYAVIKGLLIGMAGCYRESFASEHVVKLVQSFSKLVEHAPDFLTGLKHDLVNANGMALLLKN